MAAKTDQISTLLVSNQPAVIEATRSTLASQEDFYLFDRQITAENLLPVIAETQPDLILLDYSFQPHEFFELVDKIASDYPMCAVVVILPENEVINSERVILSGARAFLVFPYKPDHLVNTLKRVMELMERSQVFPVSPL